MKLTHNEHLALTNARKRLWARLLKGDTRDASPAKLPEIALTRPETRDFLAEHERLHAVYQAAKLVKP